MVYNEVKFIYEHFGKNNYDAIEKLIFEDNIRIEAVDFHPELGVMLIILNTKTALSQSISSSKLLKDAERSALFQYQLVANGTRIYWPTLDEDLSLKDFLRDELKKLVNDKGIKAS